MISNALAHYESVATPSSWADSWGMMEPGMMGGWPASRMMDGAPIGFWIWSVLAWITWVLIIIALIVFIRWMWKKGNKQ